MQKFQQTIPVKHIALLTTFVYKNSSSNASHEITNIERECVYTFTPCYDAQFTHRGLNLSKFTIKCKIY